MQKMRRAKKMRRRQEKMANNRPILRPIQRRCSHRDRRGSPEPETVTAAGTAGGRCPVGNLIKRNEQNVHAIRWGFEQWILSTEPVELVPMKFNGTASFSPHVYKVTGWRISDSGARPRPLPLIVAEEERAC